MNDQLTQAEKILLKYLEKPAGTNIVCANYLLLVDAIQEAIDINQQKT